MIEDLLENPLAKGPPNYHLVRGGPNKTSDPKVTGYEGDDDRALLTFHCACPSCSIKNTQYIRYWDKRKKVIYTDCFICHEQFFWEVAKDKPKTYQWEARYEDSYPH